MSLSAVFKYMAKQAVDCRNMIVTVAWHTHTTVWLLKNYSQRILTYYTRILLANVNSRSRSLYAVAGPSVVYRLSVVCNVRAPYSGGSNFRQYFYGIRYFGQPLTSTENIHGGRPRGTPTPGELTQEGLPSIAISDLSMAISRKRCK